MKRIISFFLALVMVFTMVPSRAFASELDEGIPTEAPASGEISVPAEETDPTEDPAPTEETDPTEDPTPTQETDPAPPERVCLEGCILEGEEEHQENGGECFVWIPCGLTEGCEGPEGHEGDCYGAAFYADAATITVSGSSYRSKYVVISDGTTSGLYYISSSGTVQNADGTAVTFEPGTYTVYYGMGGSGSGKGNESSFAGGTVTVRENSASASVSLSSKSVKNSTANVQLYATSLYHNTAKFDHVDLRVEGSYVIERNGKYYTATVSNPTVVVKVGSSQVAEKTWSGTTDYEWRQTGLNLVKASVITVDLTLDLTYTDADGKKQTLKDVNIVYDNVNDQDRFIHAIAICDMVQGFDFEVTVEDIQEVIEYHKVSYEWKVYNTDGTYTNLPAGAPSAPAATSGHEAGTEYVYNTSYATGTSFYDYDNGLLYTFHGWDTYSHSATYNPIPSTGYYALDDGDTNGDNNPTITITADTYIYGYWTITGLEPATAHVAIEKVFVVDGQKVTMEEAKDLWFHIDTGIDKDEDGDTTIDVDYAMLLAGNGEYKIPVYQYDTPFVFTEKDADVFGYTRTTTISVSGDYVTGSSQTGDTVTVTMEPGYTGENIHLGTVTYTNTYTKNVGPDVDVYPTLTLLKTAADTHLAQEGVEFTLYSDDTFTTPVTTITTGEGGIAYLDFANLENAVPGTYYLKEVQPLEGYKADSCAYSLSLTAAEPVEELRDGQYVQVTYYDLSIDVPENSTTVFDSSQDRLHLFNAPILGSLQLSKDIQGMDESDKSKLSAVVILHGPITRDDAGAITHIGGTWQLELNSDNQWKASQGDLPVGEYLIHESFASVHGYTWTGVTYGQLATEVYNNITSGVFKVTDETAITLTLINTYKEWTAADFYIKKVNESGKALAGAVFTLSTDEAGNNVVTTKTTGADGYAHFDGYTVPEGQESVTYYVRETKAPASYYLSNQIYKVVIKAVTSNGTTSYEPEISLVNGRSDGFNIDTDLLTVTNYPVLGELTITKAFENGTVPDGLERISVQISGPDGYSKTVELSGDKNWAITVEGLALGTYTISELDSNVPGYTWDVSYDSRTVTLTEANPGLTVPGTEISENTTITNTYTRNEEVYDVPTSLTVKKVGENGEALAGAVFTLDRMSADGKTVLSSTSFTTGSSGTVTFDLLTGFVQNGEAVDGTYILSETTAPAGYEATDATWTVVVKEDGNGIRWELNEDKNIFEGFWDWLVGNESEGTFVDGVLTVKNVRSKGSLTIQKTVADPKGMYEGETYSFTLDCSDNDFDKTFTLKAGESKTFENIPWGTTYTLTEDTTGAAFTSTIVDGGSGKIWAAETKIQVTNTYAYSTHKNPLTLVKVDSADGTAISGAGFTLYTDAALKNKLGEEVFSGKDGKVSLPIEATGTYYLAETTTPEGYHPNSTVYVVTAEEKAVVLNAGTADAVTDIQLHIRIEGLDGTTDNQIDYTYEIENTAIQNVVVNVEKVWEDGGYHGRPEAVQVTLYRDNEAFETVTLKEENQWKHSWKDLTDEYIWSVDEATSLTEYTKAVTNDGSNWTVTNSREPKAVEITVTKAWNHNGGKDLPESITVTLYKDGEAYETVTLSEANNWTHTWKNLTDVSQWSVDETDVPSGYIKEIEVDGYKFKITNTRTINPVDVTVRKVWVATEGVSHPASVEAVLYKDGAAYETVTLNAGNNWTHTWKDLTDEHTWSVDEKSVPAGYSKNVTGNGYDFTITNTKEFTVIDVSVKKVWYGAGVAHPGSVQVTLYRDGTAYDSVTLNASNNWSHTWKNLTDEFEWAVDEPSVPSGYNKKINRNGYSFTITNTHEDIPKTGDFTSLLGLGIMAAFSTAGFGVTAAMLIAPRKKKDEEQ